MSLIRFCGIGGAYKLPSKLPPSGVLNKKGCPRRGLPELPSIHSAVVARVWAARSGGDIHKERSGRSQPPGCLERVETCCNPQLHPSGRRYQAVGACKPCTGVDLVDQAFKVDHISFRDILATIGTRLAWNGFLFVDVAEQTEDQAVKRWLSTPLPEF